MTARRWLIGILLGCLAAILIAPATRWIALAQVEQLIPFSQSQSIRLTPNPPEIRGSARNAADLTPRDYRRQLAAICLGYTGSERVPPLRNLVERFPDNASLRATILRFSCMQQVRSTGRKEETEFTSANKPGVRPSAEAIAAFEEDCRIGEELDADNAFFPFMKSIVQFADGRDHEALESIERASTKPDWREYIEDEPLGEVALLEDIYGRQSAISKTAVLAAVLLPQYSALRSAVNMAVVRAQRSEEGSDPADGIAIRHAVMTVGGLIRAQGRTAISNVVGISYVQLATALPGSKVPANETDDQRTRRFKKWTDEYIAQLRTTRPDEADWVQRQIDAGVATRKILHPFPGDIVRMVVALGMFWLGCMFLVSNAVWLAAAAGAGQLAGRLKSIRAGRPLGWRMITLCLTVLALAGSAVGLQIARIAQTVHFLIALAAEGPASDGRTLAVLCGIAASPVGLIGLTAIVALLAIRWRVPVSIALVRAYRGLALPIAAVFFLGYLALLVSTANRENQVDYYNQRWVDHEGRYAAELKNTAWIDVVK